MRHKDQPHERGKVRWRPRAEAFLRERKGEPFTAREFGERWGTQTEHARALLRTMRQRGTLYIARRVYTSGRRYANAYGVVLTREA